MTGFIFFTMVVCFACLWGRYRSLDNPLAGKVICVDPGHGGTADTDHYRIGPGGEREEWINLRVALLLQKMLENRGARVVMTRTEDVPVELSTRAQLAVENDADLFLSIHHNATADAEVNFPIVFFHGQASENEAGVELGRILLTQLRETMFDSDTPTGLVSDHAIFPEAGANVLRNSYPIPGIIGEASFFSNIEEEKRLKQPGYNKREAEAYLATLVEFFSRELLPVAEKRPEEIPPLPVLEEADRMKEEALSWHEFYNRGASLQENEDCASLEEALNLFTRSARAFPDSPVAQECHQRRAEILVALGREREAEFERRRAREHYVSVE